MQRVALKDGGKVFPSFLFFNSVRATIERQLTIELS